MRHRPTSSTIAISTRRLNCRPASVSLVAIGSVSPRDQINAGPTVTAT